MKETQQYKQKASREDPAGNKKASQPSKRTSQKQSTKTVFRADVGASATKAHRSKATHIPAQNHHRRVHTKTHNQNFLSPQNEHAPGNVGSVTRGAHRLTPHSTFIRQYCSYQRIVGRPSSPRTSRNTSEGRVEEKKTCRSSPQFVFAEHDPDGECKTP